MQAQNGEKKRNFLFCIRKTIKMHLFRKKNAKSLVNSKKSSTFARFFRRKRKFEKKTSLRFFRRKRKFEKKL